MSYEPGEPIIPEVISPPPVTQQPDRQGLAIASLVMGALTLLTACLVVCAPLGIAGIVTGILGLNSSKTGLAIAGIVLSAIGIIASIIIAIVYGSLIPVFTDSQNWNFDFEPYEFIP